MSGSLSTECRPPLGTGQFPLAESLGQLAKPPVPDGVGGPGMHTIEGESLCPRLH